MICVYCGSNHTRKNGNRHGWQGYKCLDCGRSFLDGKYEDPYLYHFNVRIMKKDRNNLTRENYCNPTNKMCYELKRFIRNLNAEYQSHTPSNCDKYWEKYLKFPNKNYADKEHYSDEWVKKHYEDCMKNFDLNMEYFESLNYDQFDMALKTFVNKHRFTEVDNLDSVTSEGIYIMVLDKYKQAYIGVSSNVRERIINHWRKRKEFDRLVYGNVEDSVLSIDSFGALDTTRIFYKRASYYDIFSCEEKYVKKFDSRYLLNRVAGGINDEYDTALRNLKLVGSRIKRKLV